MKECFWAPWLRVCSVVAGQLRVFNKQPVETWQEYWVNSWLFYCDDCSDSLDLTLGDNADQDRVRARTSVYMIVSGDTFGSCTFPQTRGFIYDHQTPSNSYPWELPVVYSRGISGFKQSAWQIFGQHLNLWQSWNCWDSLNVYLHLVCLRKSKSEWSYSPYLTNRCFMSLSTTATWPLNMNIENSWGHTKKYVSSVSLLLVILKKCNCELRELSKWSKGVSFLYGYGGWNGLYIYCSAFVVFTGGWSSGVCGRWETQEPAAHVDWNRNRVLNGVHITNCSFVFKFIKKIIFAQLCLHKSGRSVAFVVWVYSVQVHYVQGMSLTREDTLKGPSHFFLLFNSIPSCAGILKPWNGCNFFYCSSWNIIHSYFSIDKQPPQHLWHWHSVHPDHTIRVSVGLHNEFPQFMRLV